MIHTQPRPDLLSRVFIIFPTCRPRMLSQEIHSSSFYHHRCFKYRARLFWQPTPPLGFIGRQYSERTRDRGFVLIKSASTGLVIKVGPIVGCVISQRSKRQPGRSITQPWEQHLDHPYRGRSRSKATDTAEISTINLLRHPLKPQKKC